MPLLVVVELRQCLELLLACVVDRVIRIGARPRGRGRRPTVLRSGTRRSGLRGTGRRTPRRPRRRFPRLVRPLDLAELARDTALANAEKAADADHDQVDVAILFGHQVLDRADLLILSIVYVHADELGALPQSGRRSRLSFAGSIRAGVLG